MGTLFSVIFWLSIICSFIALFYTAIVRSWQSFLALGIASLPLSLYLLSGEPPIQFVGLISFICFAISFVVFWRGKRKPIV